MKRTPRLMRIVAIIACPAILVFLIVGAVKHWVWAGFDKPLYDWMQLLIIPVVLALIAIWFNRIDKKNEQTIAQQRADAEQALATDNQQETALQGYIDRMSELLLHEKLRKSNIGDEVRTIARSRTLTVLSKLDAFRKGTIIQFLYESNLIQEDASNNIIDLNGADMMNAYLCQAVLKKVNLQKVFLIESDISEADLSGANLSEAFLNESDMREINLANANLSGADLSEANLANANLSGADLSHTHLFSTDLTNANLTNANLRGAILNSANLTNANLSDTILDTKKN